MVVKLLCVAHEEVDHQEGHEERGDDEVDEGNYPKPPRQHLGLVLTPQNCSSMPPIAGGARHTDASEAPLTRAQGKSQGQGITLSATLKLCLIRKFLSNMASRRQYRRFHSMSFVSITRLRRPRKGTLRARTPLRSSSSSARILRHLHHQQHHQQLRRAGTAMNHLVEHPDQEVVAPHDPSAYVVGSEVPHNAQPDVLLEKHDALQDLRPRHRGDGVIADSEAVAVEVPDL